MRFSHTIVPAYLMSAVVFEPAGADQHLARHAADDWQLQRLMSPSASQQAAESKGQVFIYDSLDIDQVEAAMDANFERIQHMMFTRVRHPAPAPDAPAYLEDDGCD